MASHYTTAAWTLSQFPTTTPLPLALSLLLPAQPPVPALAQQPALLPAAGRCSMNGQDSKNTDL